MSRNLMSAVPTYKERHNSLDPTVLLVVDLMADEASGPEDDSGESLLQWKRRMSKENGQVDIPDAVLQKRMFFETITPNWCSKAVSGLSRFRTMAS